MKSKNYKIKTQTILGFCITILFIFTVNIKAQIQELNPELQKQVLNEIEVAARFNNDLNTAKSGEPLTLILTVKNSSKSPIYFVDNSVERDYRITIKNERGEIVPLTEYGERMKNQTSVWRIISVKLESGKSRESKAGLDKLYDIAPKGKYYISVSREVVVNRVVDANRVVQEQGNWIRIPSREIEFTVN